jgi:hypothetical protein
MTNLAHADRRALKELADRLDEAVDLLREFSRESLPAQTLDGPPGTLLDQCVRLVAQSEAVPAEPVRTVHHFACTGGTLICKCLAAMPNAQVLSEVDPLSPLQDPRFAPADLLQLVRQSTRGADQQMLIELFQQNLEVVYERSRQLGQRLILRDHAHSHYCTGERQQPRPSFREIVAAKLPVVSVVTVRHPMESYMSLKANGWMHFSPPSLDEYCRRYMSFLQAYEEIPIVKYEDFLDDPHTLMRHVCDLLQLGFSEQFPDLFGVFTLTGDSGRKSDVIETRTRREIDESLAREAESSQNYRLLQTVLGYR